MRLIRTKDLGVLPFPDEYSNDQIREAIAARRNGPPSQQATSFLGEGAEVLKGIPRAAGAQLFEAIGGLPNLAAKGVTALTGEEPGFAEGAKEWAQAGSRAADWWYNDVLGPSEGYEGGPGAAVGDVAGSLLGYAATGALGGTGALAGLAVGQGSQVQQQRIDQKNSQAAIEALAESLGGPEAVHKPVDDMTEALSVLGGSGVAISEIIPVQRMLRALRPLSKVKGNLPPEVKTTLGASARRILETGGLEALQEWSAAVAQNLISKGMYDPDIAVFDSLGGELAAGFGGGAGAQGIVELIAGRRAKRYRDAVREYEEAVKAQDEARQEAARTRARTVFEEERKRLTETLALPAPDRDSATYRPPTTGYDETAVATADLSGPYSVRQTKNGFQVAGPGGRLVGRPYPTAAEAAEVARRRNEAAQESPGEAAEVDRDIRGLEDRIRLLTGLSARETAMGRPFTIEEVGPVALSINASRVRAGLNPQDTFTAEDLREYGVKEDEIASLEAKRQPYTTELRERQKELEEQVARREEMQRKAAEELRAKKQAQEEADAKAQEEERARQERTPQPLQPGQSEEYRVVEYRAPAPGFRIAKDGKQLPRVYPTREAAEEALIDWKKRHPKSALRISQVQSKRPAYAVERSVHDADGRVSKANVATFPTREAAEADPRVQAHSQQQQAARAGQPLPAAPEGQVAPQTPAGNQRSQRILGGLAQRLKTLVGEERVGRKEGQIGLSLRALPSGAEGSFDQDTIVLSRVTQTPDGRTIDQLSDEEAIRHLSDVMNHEVIHALRRLGLFTDTEWKNLVRYAARNEDKVSQNAAGRTYLERAKSTYSRFPNYTEETIEEEAVAQMFRAWVRDPRNITGKPRSLLKRILDYFKRFFKSYRTDQNLRRDVDALFKSVESGEVGLRDSDVKTAPQAPRGAVDRPTRFFRFTNPDDTRRIKTGEGDWDSYLFLSSDADAAQYYGTHGQEFEASPDAKILYEGTEEWRRVAGRQRNNENLLQYANRAAKAAKAAGYDAAHFKMQGNVGTAVFNPEKFSPVSEPRPREEVLKPKVVSGTGRNALYSFEGEDIEVTFKKNSWATRKPGYHGTTVQQTPEQLAARKPPFEFEPGLRFDEDGEPINTSGPDPTAMLGTHFSFERDVAVQFARGIYRSKHSAPPGGGTIITVRLKGNYIYRTEGEMMDEIFRMMVGSNPSVEYIIDREAYDNDITPDDMWRRYESNPDERYNVNRMAYELMVDQNEAESFFLAQEMANAYRDTLPDGTDGIIYENFGEGGTAVVVFDPANIEIVDAGPIDTAIRDANNPATQLTREARFSIVGRPDEQIGYLPDGRGNLIHTTYLRPMEKLDEEGNKRKRNKPVPIILLNGSTPTVREPWEPLGSGLSLIDTNKDMIYQNTGHIEPIQFIAEMADEIHYQSGQRTRKKPSKTGRMAHPVQEIHKNGLTIFKWHPKRYKNPGWLIVRPHQNGNESTFEIVDAFAAPEIAPRTRFYTDPVQRPLTQKEVRRKESIAEGKRRMAAQRKRALDDMLRRQDISRERFYEREYTKEQRNNVFHALANLQRGDPENIMVQIQLDYGGGALFPVVERVGDILHRMTEKYGLMRGSRNDVQDKIDIALRPLTQEYGFEREMNENIASQARAKGVSEAEVRKRIDGGLAAYAESYKQLPVFNRPQWLSREAAIAVGEKRWSDAIDHLRELRELTTDPAAYERQTGIIDPAYIEETGAAEATDTGDQSDLWDGFTPEAKFSVSAPLGTRVQPTTELDIRTHELARTLNWFERMAKKLGDTRLYKKIAGSNTGQLVEEVPWMKGFFSNPQGFVERKRIYFEDAYLPINRMLQQVKQAGGKVIDALDVYMNMQRYTGIVGDRIKHAERDLYRPIFNELKRKPASLRLADFEKFLYARHAPERNAWLLANGRDADRLSGMSDQEAADIMNGFSPAQKRVLERLGSMVDKIIANTNSTRVDGGLIAADIGQKEGSPNFQYYVPLRGWAEGLDDSEVHPALKARTQRMLGASGREDHRMGGRQSKAGDLLANVILQHSEAIMRAERNKVGLSYLNLVRENIERAEQTGNQRLLGALNASVRPVASIPGDVSYDPDTGAPMQRSSKAKNTEGFLTVKENGREVQIEIYDPRVNRAMRGDFDSGSTGPIIGMMRTLNIYLSKINTAWSPEFLLTNMPRDLQTAMILMSQYDIADLKKNTLKGIRDSWSVLWNDYAADKGREGERLYKFSSRAFRKPDPEWKKYLDEWRANGGKTEFLGLPMLGDTIKSIDRELGEIKDKPHAAVETVKRLFRGAGDYIGGWNEVFESGVRLSFYRALREKGVSSAQAAYASKNLTVNFNKGGEGKAFMNAMYLFYNASIQGSFNMVRAFGHSKRVRKIGATIMATGALLDMLGYMAMGDDDDGVAVFDKIPDWVKERNMVLPTFGIGDRAYVTIPLPYGFNAIFNFGRNLSAYSRGQMDMGKQLGEMEAIGSMLGTAFESFNPLGGSESFYNFMAPTIADPWVSLAQNQDFTGRRIAPENLPFGPQKPNSQLFWNSTGEVSKEIAETMNWLTGGNEARSGFLDISPTEIEYLWDFFTGAAGTFVRRVSTFGTETLPEAMSGGLEDLDIGAIPFLRKWVGNVTDRADMESYYENTKDVFAADYELKHYRDAKQPDEVRRVQDDYGGLLRIAPYVRRMDRLLGKLRKELVSVRANPNMTEEQKDRREDAITNRIDSIVTQVNRVYTDAIN